MPSFGPRFWFVETTEGGERRRVGFQERRPTQADAELEARRADVGTAVCIISLDDRYPANELSRECVAQGVFVRKPREMAASPRRGRGGSRRGGLGAVHSGQFFVIIDTRTGQAVNREIYDNVDAADAALDSMGGEARTGFQVVDAVWHNPTRARMKASGMGVDGLRTPRGLGALDKNTLEQWREEPFREPDVFDGRTAIWYGPDGPDGENATVATLDSGYIAVEEYTYVVGLIDEPDQDYTVQSTTLDVDDVLTEVDRVLLQLRKYPLGYADNDDDIELLRWAAGIGVAKLAYWGGEESWADELPR